MPDPADPLILGPVLRRVDGSHATVWVQTAEAATVSVQAGPASGAARTFQVYGRHYALVVVDGLPPASATPYQLLIDGVQAWPRPDDPYPPCVIRTRADDQPVRVVFGSCRQASPYTTHGYPPDALDSYADRLADAVRDGHGDRVWPDTLLLLGDQVYADETSPKIRRWLSRRRRSRRPDAPAEQVVGFDEYSQLYLESWTDPEVRWLLSTVPSMMIFDDHEIIDDWNTSESWRADAAAQSWWADRITAGLASYWVYQHLGNLSPAQLSDDEVYRAVTTSADATKELLAFGASADADREVYRWSHCRDIGRTRVVVLDNRAGRHLDPGRRMMLPEQQWRWFDDAAHGDYDHLVVGSSLPWLLPPALHHVEAMNEWLAGSRRRPVAAVAEKIRRALDLEHWAAFRHSFDALSALLRQLATAHPGSDDGDRSGRPPASISVLSGDVHHSYAARALLGPEAVAPVHQLTCSPVHNRVPAAIRPALAIGWSRGAALTARTLARLAGTPKPGIRWRRTAGPFFGNAISTLTLTGRQAHLVIESTNPDRSLSRLADLALTADGPTGPADGPAASGSVPVPREPAPQREADDPART